MSAEQALLRLRDPEHPAVRELASLLVEDALTTPVRELVDPAWLAAQIATSLEAISRTERVVELAERGLEDAMNRWGSDDSPLRSTVPDTVIEPLMRALQTPYVPSEEVVWRIVDQPMFRSLMAEVLENSITGFRQRMSGVDDKLLGGLGRRAAKRGRGLFGGMAESVVGAVAGEVEHQFDRRLKDFLGKATTEALRVVSRHVSDPGHAPAYAEVRVGIVEAFLDAPVSELADEVRGANPMAYVQVFLQGIRGAVADADFVADSTRRLTDLMDEVGDGTFGAWLDEVGLREVWVDSTTSLMTERLRASVQTAAFSTWWAALHAP